MAKRRGDKAEDDSAYLSCVIDRVRSLAADADVIVLAQASVADVVPLVGELDAVLLSSPRRASRRPSDSRRDA